MQDELNPQPADSGNPTAEPQVILPQTAQAIQPETAAIPTPLTQQENQDSTYAPQGFSQSDALALDKKSRRKKIFIIVGGIVFGLLALLVVFMILMDSMYGLKTINFDNGNGAKFSMKFYKKYHTSSAQIKDKGTLKLVSEVSVKNKAPVVIFIDGGHTTVSDADWQKSPNRQCTNSAPLVYTVHNSNVAQDINLCLVSKNGDDEAAYLAVMRYKDKIYPMLITQDLNFDGLEGGRDDPKAQKTAQKVLKKTDLRVYKDDLTEIISSIKPQI